MTDRACGEDEELDMDSVHSALRDLQQELKNTQRDRVYLNFILIRHKPQTLSWSSDHQIKKFNNIKLNTLIKYSVFNVHFLHFLNSTFMFL